MASKGSQVPCVHLGTPLEEGLRVLILHRPRPLHVAQDRLRCQCRPSPTRAIRFLWRSGAGGPFPDRRSLRDRQNMRAVFTARTRRNSIVSRNPPRAPEGMLSCCLSPPGDCREDDTDRSIARGANGTVQCNQSRSVTATSTRRPPAESKSHLGSCPASVPNPRPGNLWSHRKGLSLTAKCRDLPCPLPPPSDSEAGTCLTQPARPARPARPPAWSLGTDRQTCPWGIQGPLVPF